MLVFNFWWSIKAKERRQEASTAVKQAVKNEDGLYDYVVARKCSISQKSRNDIEEKIFLLPHSLTRYTKQWERENEKS